MSNYQKVKLQLMQAQLKIANLEADLSTSQQTIWSLMGCPKRIALPAPALTHNSTSETRA